TGRAALTKSPGAILDGGSRPEGRGAGWRRATGERTGGKPGPGARPGTDICESDSSFKSESQDRGRRRAAGDPLGRHGKYRAALEVRLERRAVEKVLVAGLRTRMHYGGKVRVVDASPRLRVERNE